MRLKLSVFLIAISMAVFAQGVIDVHSHLITPEYLASLKSHGALLDEGFPLPAYNVEDHLEWMNQAGVQTSVLTLAAPQPFYGEDGISKYVLQHISLFF